MKTKKRNPMMLALRIGIEELGYPILFDVQNVHDYLFSGSKHGHPHRLKSHDELYGKNGKEPSPARRRGPSPSMPTLQKDSKDTLSRVGVHCRTKPSDDETGIWVTLVSYTEVDGFVTKQYRQVIHLDEKGFLLGIRSREIFGHVEA